jgi:hypothetical protein
VSHYRRTINRIESILENLTADQARRWPGLVDGLYVSIAEALSDEACAKADHYRDVRKDERATHTRSAK